MRRALCAVALLVALAAPAAIADDAVPAHQVKAAFIYNFTKFVTWPESSFAGPGAPIRLGVIGEDPLAEALRVVEGREAQGRRVEVVRLGEGDAPSHCHVIYVAASAMSRADAITGKAKGAPVLTVGDSPQFTARGGMINFVVAGERVRIQICAARAGARGLKISSKLLSLVQIVDCAAN
jgi:hypothetical protein